MIGIDMNAGKKPDNPDVRMGLRSSNIYKTFESSPAMVDWIMGKL
jgi:hypothetical protein